MQRNKDKISMRRGLRHLTSLKCWKSTYLISIKMQILGNYQSYQVSKEVATTSQVLVRHNRSLITTWDH